jgi:hypothetical protein
VSSEVVEISEKCRAEIDYELDKFCLKNGESATLTISSVAIANRQIKDYKVYVYGLPNGLTVDDAFPNPDAAGVTKCTLRCNKDNFEGTVNFKVDYEYYLVVTEASAGGQSETGKEFKRGGVFDKTATFSKCPDPPYLDRILLHISGGGCHDGPGSYQLSYNCIDQYGNPMDCSQFDIIPPKLDLTSQPIIVEYSAQHS